MSTTTSLEEQYLAQTLSIASTNVHKSGGPFGAVIVSPEGRVFEGANRVTATNDPTAHAEVMAIREACRSLDTFDLSGCVLYSSCEPCPMCLSSALWARVKHVVYAADRHDAARAGFDDALFYEYFSTPVEARSMPVRQCRLSPAAEISELAPFEAWSTLAARVDY